ncbi:MAG: hypothetical protein ACN2B6_08330 [Rickettsiales bacterium]
MLGAIIKKHTTGGSFLMRIIAATVAMLMLSGCADHLAQLRELRPVANGFEGALATEYLDYAESEAEQDNMDNAQYFAAKGVRSARGENVAPEMPTTFLPSDSQKDLVEARTVLMALLTDDIKRVNAQGAARAQLLYDCWLSRERQRDEDADSSCAYGFRNTLDELQKVADVLVYGKEAKHTLKFAPSSSNITPRSKAIIKEIATRMKRAATYNIELQANEPGVDNVLSDLSRERIEKVTLAFAEAGIGPDKISEKTAGSGNAVLLSSDVEETSTVDIIVHTYAMPGGPKT